LIGIYGDSRFFVCALTLAAQFALIFPFFTSKASVPSSSCPFAAGLGSRFPRRAHLGSIERTHRLFRQGAAKLSGSIQ
jgi:hypothetical protein